jgi:hypothetical protein
MSRGPFAVRSFGGIYACDRLVRGTVVEALEVYATSGKVAAMTWLAEDDASVAGGWSALAVAATVALGADLRGRNGDVQMGGTLK